MSYRKIFSVVNEHTASTVTARYAISLAAADKAELVLYAAHGEGTDETILRHTERHLDHLFAAALERGITVTRITEAGSLATLLPQRVQAERADLVFYPLTPGERYGETLPKRNVQHLLRTIGSDLAIMRIVHMGRPDPRHILVPLGGIIGDRERRVLFIAALAKSFHSRVTLFHLAAGTADREMPGDIARFREELQWQHVVVLERRGSGNIGRSITVEAITRHNDLIVLGASERGPLRRLFFGNPAGAVMVHPPCNALLFRSASGPT
jgi:nucleotide-binding universal stress UspA family protein